MKKFLSLVLALVMTMSLVTISAGAKDFTDDDKIAYDEAVSVLSEIGVVDGYADGNFNPDVTLNRGQAAKIICNLILGPTTAAALAADTAPYSDVPVDHHFSGYIAYCSQQGIISGYADGTFRPAGTLTGYAFMKMLLGALGYDSDVEGYTGANWSIAVAKQALNAGLDNGNDEFAGTKAVTREEACLYAFNALKATMVDYSSKVEVNNGNGNTVTISGGRYDVPSQVDKNKETIKKDGLMQFAEKYFTKLTRTTKGADAFGRPASEWKFKSTVIGTYADDSDLIATYTDGVSKGELYDLIGGSTVKGIGTGDDDYKLSVIVDGRPVADGDDKADYFVKNASGGAANQGKGALVEVYMDDDNNVTIVVVNTYLVKATADYNTKKETLSIEAQEINSDKLVTPNLPTSISNDDLKVEDFKEDDYILVTYSYETDAIESVALAEIVTGEVTEYTESKNVIVGGEKYSYNHQVGDTEKGTEYTIGEDAVVVMDAYGYILYVKEAVSTSSYVYINSTAYTTGLNKSVIAAAYFTDGTYEEVGLKKVTVVENGKNVSYTDAASLKAASGWYTYSRNGEKLVLTEVKDPMVQEDVVTFDAGEPVTTNGKVAFMTGAKGNSSTIFVVLDADDNVDVYTGVAKVPTIKVSANAKDDAVKVQYVEKNGYAKYVFIDASGDAKASIDDTDSVADYLMILKSTGKKTVSGEDTYYQYKVIIDGEETTKYINEYILTENGSLYYNVKQNDKGFITNATPFGGKSVQETVALKASTFTQSSDTVTIAGEAYIVGEDCTITLVVGPKATALLKDVDADYELYQGISAKAVAGMVKGYELTGTAYVEVDEADSDVMVNLYIWVAGASEIAE